MTWLLEEEKTLPEQETPAGIPSWTQSKERRIGNQSGIAIEKRTQ